MMKKTICICGAVGLLAMAGCISGMYSSDVSVGRNGNGVSDYTVVNSLEVKEEYPQSMPVVVESKSTNQKGEHVLIDALWFFTLGIIPGVGSETTTYDVRVKTPIGEKSGTCTIEASFWAGWLPIFVPYPGIADERTRSIPRLPNATLEGKVRDQLVANLVSQFPKSEYASFAARYNSPELKAQRAKEAAERERLAKEHAEAERVRLAKEAAERERLAKERAEAERVRLAKEAAERAEKMRFAMRTALYEKTVENDLEAIKKCYSRGKRYENPFLGNRGRERDEKTDWLSKWVSSRLGLSDADALAGEALLAEFGMKYLPNAYSNYEKKRDVLVELQQIFNEEFSQPWTIKTTNPKWNSFNKVLEKFVKARTEYFICHDELCHFWLLSRFGVLTDKDFALIDSQRLAVHLLPENIECADYTLLEVNPMEGKISDFAIKYAPESNAIYQKMGREFKELDTLLSEVFKQRILMDDARHSRVLDAAVGKRNDLAREMNALSLRLQTWYMDHRTTEKSSEDIAKCDAAMKMQLKPFMDALSSYIKERALGPVIAKSEMIAIPGQRYRMQRTEVTQLQWMAVMGNNPSYYRGSDQPVENVSWNDCQEFIKRASQMDGRKYRLPTEDEWEYACRAGGTGDWGKRANGEEGPLDAMGWYDANSGDKTHSVAQKEPNAWGLYDMHGNVWEWTSTAVGDDRVYRGGSLNDDSRSCAAGCRIRNYPGRSDYRFGFRLVSEDL